MSAGGSSVSNVRGQVSHRRLHRLVTSRYRQTGSVAASAARLCTASKYRRGLLTTLIIRSVVLETAPEGGDADRSPRGQRRAGKRPRERQGTQLRRAPTKAPPRASPARLRPAPDRAAGTASQRTMGRAATAPPAKRHPGGR